MKKEHYLEFSEYVNERFEGMVDVIIESYIHLLEGSSEEQKLKNAMNSFFKYLEKHNPKKAAKIANDFKKLYKEAKANTPDYASWAKENPNLAAAFYVGVGMSPAATANYIQFTQMQQMQQMKKQNRELMKEQLRSIKKINKS